MIKKNQRLLNLANGATDFGLNVLAFLAAYYLRFYVVSPPERLQPVNPYIQIALLNGVAIVLIYALLQLYEPKRKNTFLRDISIIARGNFVDILVVGVFLYLFRFVDFSRMLLFLYFIINTTLVSTKHLALRSMLRNARSKGYNIKHILLVGNGQPAERYAREIALNTELGYNIVGVVVPSQACAAPCDRVAILGCMNNLDALLAQPNLCDEVIIAFDEDYARLIGPALQACNRHGVRFSIIPFFEKYIFSASSPQVDTIGGVQVFDFCASPLDQPVNKFFKRLFDIVVALFICIVLCPVWLVAAVGVKISSRGPVLFKQKRVGYKKDTFNIYKFRSMYMNDRQDTAWSSKNDARTTPFGRLLRKTSVDELPQLINVLKGDMSLIGPRPEIPFHVEHFKDEIPYYMARHQIRPGLSGWAQVNGYRGDTSITERVKYDLYYIYNWSPLFDVQILFKTVFGGIISKAE